MEAPDIGMDRVGFSGRVVLSGMWWEIIIF